MLNRPKGKNLYLNATASTQTTTTAAIITTSTTATKAKVTTINSITTATIKAMGVKAKHFECTETLLN